MVFLKQVSIKDDKMRTPSGYPFSIPTIKEFKEMKFKQNVTFFVGENGSGKSTLLEGIADGCGFNLAGGSQNDTYNVHRSDSSLSGHLRLSWLPKVNKGFFLRAESFYHFASYLDRLHEEDPTYQYNRYGGKSLHEQSHGESFLSLFLHRFEEQAIYLLDEPEAALSPQRQLSFMKIMHDLTKDGQCQFIIATHSPILLGYPDATIYRFDEGKIEETSYEMTDHYTITSYFLQNRERFLYELFQEDEQ
ncbi:ATPase AAA [Bacillus coahuilensis m2-6]|uniref:AAA family ATPase n=1 Tax=Bacillus coahuilensis TaxID=408580 RepID=UPI0001851001|nr:AAA family ATPase [Bacillus coahuilensis]KUP09827.1 ATPase AAA [Bacillus coahuilensis m2-6]